MFVSLKMQAAYYIIRPHLHGLGYHRQSFPRVTLDELTSHLFLIKNSANRLHEVINSSQVHETTRGGEAGNFSSCKHLVSPTRYETTRTENACARHDQNGYIYFFPAVRHFVKYVTWPNEGQQTLNFM